MTTECHQEMAELKAEVTSECSHCHKVLFVVPDTVTELRTELVHSRQTEAMLRGALLSLQHVPAMLMTCHLLCAESQSKNVKHGDQLVQAMSTLQKQWEAKERQLKEEVCVSRQLEVHDASHG